MLASFFLIFLISFNLIFFFTHAGAACGGENVDAAPDLRAGYGGGLHGHRIFSGVCGLPDESPQGCHSAVRLGEYE